MVAPLAALLAFHRDENREKARNAVFGPRDWHLVKVVCRNMRLFPFQRTTLLIKEGLADLKVDGSNPAAALTRPMEAKTLEFRVPCAFRARYVTRPPKCASSYRVLDP